MDDKIVIIVAAFGFHCCVCANQCELRAKSPDKMLSFQTNMMSLFQRISVLIFRFIFLQEKGFNICVTKNLELLENRSRILCKITAMASKMLEAISALRVYLICHRELSSAYPLT